MASRSTSIQSFFSPSPKKSGPAVISEPEAGDGFAASEKDAVLHPNMASMNPWQPVAEYKKVHIGELMPGPQQITFVGRIVNFYHQPSSSKMPRTARGCYKTIVKDDTGAITVRFTSTFIDQILTLEKVRLWYANLCYPLVLGQLVSVWTPHVSDGKTSSLSVSSAPLCISIFPERDRISHFGLQVDTDGLSLCGTPSGCVNDKALEGLMTMKSFIEGGSEVNKCKILVCVKSIGAKKKGMCRVVCSVYAYQPDQLCKVINKRGLTNELLNVTIFDHTDDATLTLWGPVTASAYAWKTSQTILLITDPAVRLDTRTTISLTSNTHVDVDPAIRDAETPISSDDMHRDLL